MFNHLIKVIGHPSRCQAARAVRVAAGGGFHDVVLPDGGAGFEGGDDAGRLEGGQLLL